MTRIHLYGLLATAILVAGSSLPGPLATAQPLDDEISWNTIHVRGERLPFAIPLSPLPGERFHYRDLNFWCWPPNVNDFGFALLLPAALLANGTDLWRPPEPREYPILREDVRYHRPMAQRSDHYASVRVSDVSVFVGEENVFPIWPDGYPSNDTDTLDLGDRPHWWIFSCPGKWELDVAYAGASAGPPVELARMQRAVWSEHHFEETAHVASGSWGLPNPAVGTEAQYAFEVDGPQFVFVAMQTGMGYETYRLTSPSGEQMPFWKNHQSGFGTGGAPGGTIVIGVRDFEVDRIVTEPGTWRLVVDPKATPNFEASVYRLDLSPLVAP